MPHMKVYFAIASYQFRKDVKINILKRIYFAFFVANWWPDSRADLTI